MPHESSDELQSLSIIITIQRPGHNGRSDGLDSNTISIAIVISRLRLRIIKFGAMLETLWVDKYHPKTLNALSYHQDVNDTLRQLASTNDFPHLIIYGPEGAGKKTRATAFIQQVYGVNSLQLQEEEKILKPEGTTKTIEYTIFSSHHHIEITPADNDNDDRFIIQNVVKEIAASKAIGQKADKNFKVLVINEADRLSKEAQGSLRRTMEKYISHCRMILLCKHIHKLIMPIRSRCINIRVPAPTNEHIRDVLIAIGRDNGMEMTDQLLNRIVKVSSRNMRDAISQLECYKYSKKNDDIMHPYLPEIRDVAKFIQVEQSPTQLQKVRDVFYDLLVNCVPGNQILRLVLEEIVNSGKIKDELLKGLIHEAARLEVTMAQGSKAIIHLQCFAAHAMEAMMKVREEM